MNDGHGSLITAAQLASSDRRSLKTMEQNMYQSSLNTAWSCGVVFNDRLGKDLPNLAHTVGLAERGFPELVMLGAGEMQAFIPAVELITQHWDDNNGYYVGPVRGVTTLRLVEIDAEQFRHGFGRMLEVYYAKRRALALKVVQVIMVDERGLWPDAPNYPWNKGRAFLLPTLPYGAGVTHAERA